METQFVELSLPVFFFLKNLHPAVFDPLVVVFDNMMLKVKKKKDCHEDALKHDDCVETIVCMLREYCTPRSVLIHAYPS